MLNIILPIILITLVLFFIFILLIKNKILKLEKIILNNFKEKNNLIPSIFEVTKEHFTKHKEIFNELLILKNKNFWENSYFKNLNEKSRTYKLIHKELDFILRVASKHHKLEKDPKFTLIKENIISKSEIIWNNIIKYKSIINKFNKLILLKNLTVIWLLIPIKKINNI